SRSCRTAAARRARLICWRGGSGPAAAPPPPPSHTNVPVPARLDSASFDAGVIAAADARVSHAAYYYDAARRLVGVVDVETNGDLPCVRPGTVPTRFDLVLIADYHYNDAGWVDEVTDPSGVRARTLYDALGRAIQVIAH